MCHLLLDHKSLAKAQSRGATFRHSSLIMDRHFFLAAQPRKI